MKLRHGRVALELHLRRDGSGTPLLLLHELRGSSASWGGEADAWPGPIHALDFSGHGASERVRGGAYSPELLAGDADAALEHIGSAVLVGAGLGAYVALLLAAARPAAVPAALLLSGVGLAGGGALPDSERVAGIDRVLDGSGPGDARLGLLDTDVRPVDYAEQMAARARRLLLLENGGLCPPWWDAVRQAGCAKPVESFAEALAALADVLGPPV